MNCLPKLNKIAFLESRLEKVKKYLNKVPVGSHWTSHKCIAVSRNSSKNANFTGMEKIFKRLSTVKMFFNLTLKSFILIGQFFFRWQPVPLTI